MPQTIIEMARAKRDSMMQNPAEAGQNAIMAIAAINGGIRSLAWRSYMMQFLQQSPPGQPIEPLQLERLLATDDTLGDPVLDMRRAYLVADGVCGAGTPDTFTDTVDSIDFTLPDGCDPRAVQKRSPTQSPNRYARKRRAKK